MLLRTLILLAPAGVLLAGTPEEPPAPPEAPQAAVEKIDGSRFRIGKVTFDNKTREIRFPAKVNMTEGLLEFLLVNEKGKLHESLFSTDASPTHINLAFTLLRYPASRELRPLPGESGAASDKFPDVPDEVKNGARVAIEVEWDADGTTRRMPVNEWIQHAPGDKTMAPGPWVYGGSEFFEGKYIPETSGDLVGIVVDPAAIINYPGEDARNDDVWLPFPERVPASGTVVSIIIKPFSNTPAPATP